MFEVWLKKEERTENQPIYAIVCQLNQGHRKNQIKILLGYKWLIGHSYLGLSFVTIDFKHGPRN